MVIVQTTHGDFGDSSIFRHFVDINNFLIYCIFNMIMSPETLSTVSRYC